MDWLLIVVGLALLVAGGEALVRGASGVALLARVTPAVVGLTIVAAGTSMPEMVVSVQSAIEESPGLAIGNVVGSNLFNIGLILGLTALIVPLRILGNSVKLEWPVMMLASFQLLLLVRDGQLDRLEGAFFVTGVIAFVSYAVWIARRNTGPEETQELDESLTTASFGRTGGAAIALNVVAILVGAGLLAGGSTALVHGAVNIASALGVSETIIGLTIVSVGTSAPELATSLVAARRGRDDVAVANVIGSNIFNILGIAGVTALIHPLPVPAEIVTRDVWWMLAVTAVLLPMMAPRLRLSRVSGAILFAAYLAYAGLLVHDAMQG
ncbi:MAG: calcium/sodium antiporter [Myxococcota bacterium]|jgi:cation:H+ antiporter|nr:calcium/sodium antiporter [Myxococcota bacterium]